MTHYHYGPQALGLSGKVYDSTEVTAWNTCALSLPAALRHAETQSALRITGGCYDRRGTADDAGKTGLGRKMYMKLAHIEGGLHFQSTPAAGRQCFRFPGAD